MRSTSIVQGEINLILASISRTDYNGKREKENLKKEDTWACTTHKSSHKSFGLYKIISPTKPDLSKKN